MWSDIWCKPDVLVISIESGGLRAGDGRLTYPGALGATGNAWALTCRDADLQRTPTMDAAVPSTGSAPALSPGCSPT